MSLNTFPTPLVFALLLLAGVLLIGLLVWLNQRRLTDEVASDRSTAAGSSLRGPSGASRSEADDHREAIAQAAAAERERIYADLHDDLGARLLELIYSAPDKATADQARAILQDLRDVVSRSRSEPGTLLDVLASIRSEAAQRLQSAGAELKWEAADDLPDPPLDHATALHLHRIVREAISNAIRHAHARRLRVRVALGAARQLMLELTDEGGIEPPAAVETSTGTGVRNMRDRAQALHGHINWTAGTLGGTKVLLKAPLPAEATA